MRQEGEPSIEEILDSIKKVIARDALDGAGAGRGNASAGFADDGEVLDLADTPEWRNEQGGGDEEERAEVREPLTTDKAANSMRDSLAALAMLSEPGASPQIVRSGETSLESMVREMLRPMLASWLDNHLPGIVERLVKAEIARIAGKTG